MRQTVNKMTVNTTTVNTTKASQARRRSMLPVVALVVGLAVTVVGLAQGGATPMNPADVQWGPAPGFMPAGAEIAVLDGDPAAAAQLTLRLRFPAGYEFPAHWHPTQENVTVISGTFYAGMGDTLDKASGIALEPGGYVALPAEMNHFAWTEEETVVQVDMIGPFEITYVNAEDDPRNQ
ncbi:MAG TPA: cupin domain-containing protein [Trueperaceae bacterium]|nr:cupin domain-containing protein [Trueperaceae bacterium]